MAAPRVILRTALIVTIAVVTVLIADGPVGRFLARPAGPAPLQPVARAAPNPSAPSEPAATPLDPAGFAPGSCMAFPPTTGNQHRTVFLDPGHGGPDPGTSGSTSDGGSVSEKDLTLPVALATAQLLRAKGYRVVLSRTTDSTVAAMTPDDLAGTVMSTAGKHADLTARARCANLSGAGALVSVHFDGYADSSVGGATTLYDAVRPFSPANLTLATLLQQDITAGLAAGGWQLTDRGVATDDTAGGGEITPQGTAYGHLDILGPADPGYVDEPTTMPGALVEPLFITNPTECDIAVSPAGQQAIAAAVTQAVTAFLRAPPA